MVKRSMTVLGIHDGHDSGAALIHDGRVLAALQEERLRNIKHYSGTPEYSIRELFRIAGMDPSDVDVIAISSFVMVRTPSRTDKHMYLKLFKKLSPFLAGQTFAKLYVKLLHKFRKMDELKRVFRELGLAEKAVIFVEHHLSHAACAYRSSPWPYSEPVLVFTADGVGDGISSTVSVGENGELHRIAESIYYDSVGNVLYSEITRYLGLRPWDHEYKVMGLAPYGDAERSIDQIKNIIKINPNNPLEFKNTIGSYSELEQPKLFKLLQGHRFDNIAAATQMWFERLIVTWIKNAIKQTNIHKIACAGGLFLNVKANQLIVNLPEVEDAFFYPAAGDAGTPVGAGLQVYHQCCLQAGIKPHKTALTDLYFGPVFRNDEIEEVLKKTEWRKKAEFYDSIDGVIGELVAKGRIVARVNGRLEWGPRALGNRSILADARDYPTVWKINFMIKHRDFWMPFAPTILEERMHDYLINPIPARYMLLSFNTTKKRDEIVAAIHPRDKTTRPQTLNEWNPGYRRVLETFEEHTGVGGLLNTSFNLHGYPIVCTPEQAIWTMENSKLDAMALGNYLISR